MTTVEPPLNVPWFKIFPHLMFGVNDPEGFIRISLFCNYCPRQRNYDTITEFYYVRQWECFPCGADIAKWTFYITLHILLEISIAYLSEYQQCFLCKEQEVWITRKTWKYSVYFCQATIIWSKTFVTVFTINLCMDILNIPVILHVLLILVLIESWMHVRVLQLWNPSLLGSSWNLNHVIVGLNASFYILSILCVSSED